MSGAPPTVIAVKRKLGDEPLDLLYVQTEDSASVPGTGKRRRFEVKYRFVRLGDDGKTTQESKTITEADGVEKSHAAESSSSQQPLTQSKKDKTRNSRKAHARAHVQAQVQAPRLSLPATPSRLAASITSRRSASPRPARELRRFVLTKERFADTASGRHSPQHGVRKRRGTARHGVAVFSEQKAAQMQSVASPRNLSRGILDPPSRPLRESTSQTFKRPSATPQERKWREENWGARSVRSARSVSPMPGARNGTSVPPGPPGREEFESLRLAAALQRFALETAPDATNETVLSRSTASVSRSTTTKSQLSHAATTNLINDEIETDGEEEEGWVYDRYVRDVMAVDDQPGTFLQDEKYSAPAETKHLDAWNSRTGSRGAFGVLVIRDEDKEDWEAFGEEDEASDEDRYTEDEDSNAEDFYANDYPEAELSSGDEFDDPTSMYRARPRANTSEDEYDLANDAYSDDDSYGFSSADEANDQDWRKLGSSRARGKVEQMADAGDESA